MKHLLFCLLLGCQGCGATVETGGSETAPEETEADGGCAEPTSCETCEWCAAECVGGCWHLLYEPETFQCLPASAAGQEGVCCIEPGAL